MNMTEKHPSKDYLRLHNEGLLSTGMTVAVSAHLEFCGQCRDESRSMVDDLARQWCADDVPASSMGDLAAGDVDSLLSQITSQLQETEEVVERYDQSGSGYELHMHERSVKLPGVLGKIASNGVVWRQLAGGISTAPLSLDREAQCDFMYMRPGSQVPNHKHQGTEITLVLDGNFFDEMGQYSPGDFILRDGSHIHTPQSDEGCLCYTVLDSPLRFTAGWSRLLNPLQSLMFNRGMR